jgi:glycosyltransferase involved in cell wall biosynthesis
LADVVDAHVVTQIRNRDAIERTGWHAGREFTAIDNEGSARPLHQAQEWLRAVTGLGWTLGTAISSIPYYHFEHALLERFGDDIDRRRFDVVHRVTPLTPTTPSLLLARRCHAAGVPFVWGPINGGVPWPPEFADVQRAEGEWLSHVRDVYKLLPGYRATRTKAAALIPASVSVWGELSGHHERCVYVPENGIDPARFSLLAKPWRAGPLRIAFVGRLVPYKGADMLIEAAAELVRAGKVTLDIIGDGPELTRLRTLAATLHIQAGTKLDGWVAHDQLQERLASAHVFGFPSVREFGGGVVLEAMAMGIVPVVVGYAGPNELVTDRTGYRVPLDRRDKLIDGFRQIFQRLAADPTPLEAMGARARARVLTHFTWNAKAQQMLEIYRWVMGERDKPNFGMPFPDDHT